MKFLNVWDCLRNYGILVKRASLLVVLFSVLERQNKVLRLKSRNTRLYLKAFFVPFHPLVPLESILYALPRNSFFIDKKAIAIILTKCQLHGKGKFHVKSVSENS